MIEAPTIQGRTHPENRLGEQKLFLPSAWKGKMGVLEYRDVLIGKGYSSEGSLDLYKAFTYSSEFPVLNADHFLMNTLVSDDEMELLEDATQILSPQHSDILIRPLIRRYAKVKYALGFLGLPRTAFEDPDFVKLLGEVVFAREAEGMGLRINKGIGEERFRIIQDFGYGQQVLREFVEFLPHADVLRSSA